MIVRGDFQRSIRALSVSPSIFLLSSVAAFANPVRFERF